MRKIILTTRSEVSVRWKQVVIVQFFINENVKYLMTISSKPMGDYLDLSIIYVSLWTQEEVIMFWTCTLREWTRLNLSIYFYTTWKRLLRHFIKWNWVAIICAAGWVCLLSVYAIEDGEMQRVLFKLKKKRFVKLTFWRKHCSDNFLFGHF